MRQGKAPPPQGRSTLSSHWSSWKPAPQALRCASTSRPTTARRPSRPEPILLRAYAQVLATRAPASLALDPGTYHLAVERFHDFQECHGDVTVFGPQVLLFKADLSLGKFLAFLHVSTNAGRAQIYLDQRTRWPGRWGIAPHGDLVTAGSHRVWVEAPGYEPIVEQLELAPGEQKELDFNLTRVGRGQLRIDANAPRDRGLPGRSAHGLLAARRATAGARCAQWPQTAPHHGTGQKAAHYNRGGAPRAGIAHPRAAGSRVFARPRLDPGGARRRPDRPRHLGWHPSNHLYDTLADERRRGTFEPSDPRGEQGKLWAIGANLGFVVGGVLEGLAVYNFVRDPYPESSSRIGQPVEFAEPRRTRDGGRP